MPAPEFYRQCLDSSFKALKESVAERYKEEKPVKKKAPMKKKAAAKKAPAKKKSRSKK